MPLVLEPSWVGRRITVRRVIGRGPGGRLAFTDAVGDLMYLDGDRAVLDTSKGTVELSVQSVAEARVAVPSTRDELDLEAVLARGWRAADTSELGGWLLRANGGFTGRANSVLPLGQPGMPLAEALEAARGWYRQRDLPLRIQVPVHARRLLDAELGERGWPASPAVQVMAARLQTVLAAAQAPGEYGAQVSDRPDEEWLARYRGGAGGTAHARGVLTRHERAGFAAVRVDGRIAGIGRGTVDDGWLGVTAVEVDPELRRAGVATSIMRALWAWGVEGGAVRSHLEVSVDNSPALATYRRLGYWVHHDYHYRRDPAT